MRVSFSAPSPPACLGASLPHGCVDPTAPSPRLSLVLHRSKVLKTEVQRFHICPARYKGLTVSTFFTLFAAALATFATTAVAAPSPCNCPGPVKPEPVDPKPVDPKPVDPKNTPTTVRVGYTLDLHPETPLGSLSCSATFAKNFPNKFQKLGQLPTAPFYGEVRGAVDGSPASKCGTCWELQYNGQPPVYMIAVDNAATIQLGGDAFEKFAGAAGKAKGSVDATAVQVDPGKCGL